MTHQNNIKDNCVVASCCLRLGQKVVLQHTAKTIARGQISHTFCILCGRNCLYEQALFFWCTAFLRWTANHEQWSLSPIAQHNSKCSIGQKATNGVWLVPTVQHTLRKLGWKTLNFGLALYNRRSLAWCVTVIGLSITTPGPNEWRLNNPVHRCMLKFSVTWRHTKMSVK